MFQIITNSTLPDLQIRDNQLVSVPCFYLTNDPNTGLVTSSNSSTSTIELSNFAPMFTIESSELEVIDIEDFRYVLSTTPSEYQMLEINIDSLELLDDISTLYINGVSYQNFLDINNLAIFNSGEDTLPLEEREST